MSCTFWIRRKRLAAQKAAEQAKEVISEKETTTEAEEKAVAESANKRTSRKSKVGDSSDK